MRRAKLLSQSGFTRGLGKWTVTVWEHPTQLDSYCYSVLVNEGVVGGGENFDYPYDHGCFDTPREAVDAGIEEVSNG